MKHGAGEIDDQGPLRGRIKGEAEIDLVRLQIENGVSVGGFDKFKLDVEELGDVVGHLDREARPFPGGQIFLKIG